MSARLRYGCAAAAIVAGLACAAALTDSLGNTVATVLIAGGMIVLLASLLRDLGLSAGGAARRSDRPAPPPDAAGPEPPSSPAPDGEPPA